MKTKYQIKDGDKWETCLRATTDCMKEGWLHYELRDGTNAFARPGNWRIWKGESDQPMIKEYRPGDWTRMDRESLAWQIANDLMSQNMLDVPCEIAAKVIEKSMEPKP